MKRTFIVCSSVLMALSAVSCTRHQAVESGVESAQSTQFSALRAAVKSVQVPEFLDYNRNFVLETYAKTKTELEIIRDITGDEELELDTFDTTDGDAGVKEFAKILRENIIANDPDEAVCAKGYEKTAAEAEKAFIPSSQFQSVKLMAHGIEEDGDVQRDIILAKQKDGSWIALMFSDYPF